MNVSGVGATPPQPPTPPVAPAAVVTSAAGSDRRRSGEPQPQAGRPGTPGQHQRDASQQKTEHVEAPPLRMLTVTEMRIMLGQLPVSAARKAGHDVDTGESTATA